MRRYDVPRHMLAIGLAAQAGFIDALGFLKLGGLFVSFMSGNSTRLGVGIASGTAVAWTAAGLIGAFVGGVVAGALVAQRAGPWRKQAVLTLATLLLLCAALLTLSGEPDNGLTLLMAAAMGAVNNVFQRDGEVSIGVTYMTGALVKLGQQLAVALTGGAAWNWLPYLLLWLGLVAGAVTGGWLFTLMDLHALWIATASSALLLLWSIRLRPLHLA
ncbi:YoaK family protein [Sphingobium sp. Sx8-8]|uniref:YoaK family protein n=1 Tax=Sphingobium sp. Sx8-8 TaxID=2933617 RepID=UPI001F57F4EA|nr:YoaK family protein [Sphingobium sp. Sx8-8]